MPDYTKGVLNLDNKKNVIPLNETNPIRLGEETSEEAEELGVELAKKWVDENKL